MEQILTVLAGQPNCGKSTIFNMLTGARQYVANYPGVTVEKKAGSFVCGDTRVELVDLPGTYSLASWSPEEMAARQFIVEEDPAQIVAVLDASTLEKSLYLCLQLLEMRRPTLAVLNMMDVAAKRGIRVDADALSRALGIPVIPVSARQRRGLDALLHAAAHHKDSTGPDHLVHQHRTVSHHQHDHHAQIQRQNRGQQLYLGDPPQPEVRHAAHVNEQQRCGQYHQNGQYQPHSFQYRHIYLVL